MILVPRRARKLDDPQSRVLETPEAEDLQAFRSLSAWVLLGEPGAGKSTVLEQEAEIIGAPRPIRIGQFIHADIEPEWRGKTLFLDGLDEVRASGGVDSTIESIRKHLKRLGNPPFRIACRAADWYGSTDRDDLKSDSPDRQITVLLLEPLSEDDILKILRENHDEENPLAFVEQAKKYGVADLLNNPETLRLLAKAVRGNQWPESRDETYRLACEKLAEETNKRQRIKMRDQPRTLEQLLDAAGQLSAVLLLSDKTGFALDPESSDVRFPVLADFSPPELTSAYQVINRKLFRPEAEERVVPSHRSIAEYLAARWLARRIDGEGLPLGRVLNLLLGRDGRAVAGLRGLYAWLALHSQIAKPRLIESDPLTVVIYGDVKRMSLENKRSILDGLRREAEAFAGFAKTPTQHTPSARWLRRV